MALKELIVSPVEAATLRLWAPGRATMRMRNALKEACALPEGLPGGIHTKAVERLVGEGLLVSCTKTEIVNGQQMTAARYTPTGLGSAVQQRLAKADAKVSK